MFFSISNFYKGSGDEDNGPFSITIQKSSPIIKNNNDNSDNGSSTISKGPDEPEKPKQIAGISMLGDAQKGMSELEKAVLRLPKAMGNLDLPAKNDDDEEIVIKSPKNSNDTL